MNDPIHELTQTRMHQPLALTMGDPAGIGPEIIAKLFDHEDHLTQGSFVVGDVDVMRRATATIGCKLPIARIENAIDTLNVPPRCLPVLQAAGLANSLAGLPPGQVDARAGAAAIACIEQAAHLAMQGEIKAIVTAPINKESLAKAGCRYPGHTEMLQALATRDGSSPPPVRMMLANSELRVVLVTVHLPLREAIEAVTFDSVLQTLRIAHQSARSWGRTNPKIAVAGLNPHAGEGGLFGDEETHFISPAIAAACSEGINALGPFPPDTVFMRARRTAERPGEFDLVVTMIHDHGLIPIKYLGIEDGVNVTLGLPFIRTSPDHGTAFDIAGTGKAHPGSLVAALKMARALLT